MARTPPPLAQRQLIEALASWLEPALECNRAMNSRVGRR